MVYKNDVPRVLPGPKPVTGLPRRGLRILVLPSLRHRKAAHIHGPELGRDADEKGAFMAFSLPNRVCAGSGRVSSAVYENSKFGISNSPAFRFITDASPRHGRGWMKQHRVTAFVITTFTEIRRDLQCQHPKAGSEDRSMNSADFPVVNANVETWLKARFI
jgi:hypothetical protein